ncbi:hypothetical protein Pan241w_28120 [Gimesia alba]|uniref:Uncharacterized protein n=1 Tax=Gimesia alba TaxID=2527973 RepID=A0A517RFS7_9PLAN|nr:hypothetical protein [Gimesia alba]QDT42724.1 hypothetical protein Pan241w_28120 [Gimesia alba]
MDKLKPILVHKFWIILFIALLLPVIGWSMATGSLAKEIDERKAAIDKAFTDAQVPPNPPNETWSSALKEINKEKEKYIGQSHKYLWDKQKSLFVWPPDVTPLMKNTPYRGEISRVPRNLYRSAYKFEILRAHKLANPFSLKDGTGTVDISPNTIPHVPLDKWKTLPPTSEEMWDAQEDVWLVSSILEAIAEVNKGAANISESPVRQIIQLELRGGTVGDDGSAPAGDGSMGDMDGMAGMAGMDSGGFGGGGGGGRAGMTDAMGGGAMQIDVDMDLTKIFGNDVDGSAGGGDDSGDVMAESAGMLGGGFAGGQGAQNLKRYYHEDEALPYKTRAFYIKAVIQSSKLPHLLAQLSSMPWPAEIVRVQRADMFDDNLTPIASLGGTTGRRGASPMGGDAGFSADSGFGGTEFGGGRPGGGSGFSAEAGGQPGMGQPGLENKGLLDAALSDPELSVVTIAGLMTLYKPYEPPEGEMVAEAEGTNPNNPGQPAADAATPAGDAANATPAGSEANPAQPTDAAAANTENQPVPAGDTPEQPTEPASPATPAADSAPADNNPQPPPTESNSEEAANQ